MNVIQLRDPAEIYIQLSKELWAALVAVATGEDLTNLRCLEPACNPVPEIAKRQWLALSTAIAIINLRTGAGGETLTAVLADLDYCSC